MSLKHHVIYEQELRRIAGKDKALYRQLYKDERNLMNVEKRPHDDHHSGAKRFKLTDLRDSVYEFGVEVMGAGRTYNFLRRRYDGEDPRLEALLWGDFIAATGLTEGGHCLCGRKLTPTHECATDDNPGRD